MKVLVDKFVHRTGFHCESSSMRDLFEYYGFPMSEAMAFGLDGTMGFVFFDTDSQISFMGNSDIPFFLGGKQGTIEPNSLACRLLGITLKKQSFSSKDRAWEESKKLLNQNTPLILNVDIAYMPYEEIDGELEETHFGGHAITLAGYDEQKKVAYVGDTIFKGFQEVPIEILKKARSSRFGPKFMHPKNTQFSMIPRPDGKHPPLAASVKLAIQRVVNNMLRPSMNFNGIQGLKRFAYSIPEWKYKLNKKMVNSKGKLARVMFELIYGYIETWGTGGGLFRKLYQEFLEELLINPELRIGVKSWKSEEFGILKECIPLIQESAKLWSGIAETLKQVANKHRNECIDKIDLKELQDDATLIIKKEELLFKKLMKLRI